MILYLLKSGIGLFLGAGVYAVFLQKETMHHFKRLFLVGVLLLAYLTPLASIEIPVDSVRFVPIVSADTYLTGQLNRDETQYNVPDAGTRWPYLIGGLYLAVTGLLLFRFGRNVITLVRMANRQPPVRRGELTLVLVDKKTLPYTFLNRVFVDREAYNNHQIPARLLTHELAHVRQKHSLDVIGIELLICLCWFNPLLYWYRWAIRLNHEFLADSFVTARYPDVATYQYLLLSAASGGRSKPIVSELTFTNIKQRLLMMTRQTSAAKAGLLRIGALLPVIGMIGMTVAQPTLEPVVLSRKIGRMDQPVANDTTETKQAAFYKNTKFLSKDRQGRVITRQFSELTPSEKRGMRYPIKPLPRQEPTAAQMKAWTNSRQYGVWLDDKRVSNQVLTQYKPSDFVSYFESKLEKNAANYGKHYVQVDLMTPANYDKHVKDMQTPPLTIRFFR